MMAPKSLLRNQGVSSSLDELENGEFQRVIPDTDVDAQGVKRVLLCSGKVYYDLVAEREKLERSDVAIVRLEQLYPLSDEDLQAVLAHYADGVHVVWVQEEPANMGAWQFPARPLRRPPLRALTLLRCDPPRLGEPCDRLRECAQVRAS